MAHTLHIEIFKTNVLDSRTANQIIKVLVKQFPSCRFNFDLDDCDHILRVETTEDNTKKIINTVEETGFLCQLID